MSKPVWILKGRKGCEVWWSSTQDYLTALELALKFLGCELVQVNPDQCPGRGVCPGSCICQRERP